MTIGKPWEKATKKGGRAKGQEWMGWYKKKNETQNFWVGGTSWIERTKREGWKVRMNHSEQGGGLDRGTCTLRKMTQMESRRADPKCLKEGLVVVRETEGARTALPEESDSSLSRAVQPSDPLAASWWESLSSAEDSLASRQLECGKSLDSLIISDRFLGSAQLGDGMCGFGWNRAEMSRTMLLVLMFTNSNI